MQHKILDISLIQFESQIENFCRTLLGTASSDSLGDSCNGNTIFLHFLKQASTILMNWKIASQSVLSSSSKFTEYLLGVQYCGNTIFLESKKMCYKIPELLELSSILQNKSEKVKLFFFIGKHQRLITKWLIFN